MLLSSPSCLPRKPRLERSPLLLMALAGASTLTVPVAAESLSDAVELKAITVTAQPTSDENVHPMERETKAGKIKARLQDIPASISVVDKQFIQDTGAKNIQDALLYSSGVYAGQYGFDTRGDWASVRGLKPSNYVDGLRSIYGYYNAPRTEIYTLESIEVLKGPSSALYGQGELGGIVNAVSKLPMAEQQGEIWAQVGSFNNTQLATDITGALSDDGKWLYRLVALERQSGTQVDYVDNDGHVVAPSITWKPAEGTTLMLLLNQQEIDSGVSAQFLPSRGTIEDAPRGQVPTNTFIGEPGWDRYDQQKQEATFFAEQQINTQWAITTTLRKTATNAVTREHWPVIGAIPDDDGNVARTLYTADTATDVFSFDLHAEGAFDLGITHHTLAIGIDRQDATWESENYVYSRTGGGVINLYDPQYGNLDTSALVPVDRPDNQIEQTGLYVIDHMEIGRTVVSAALRQDDADSKTLAVSGPDRTVTDKENTGRIGVMYRFDSGVSPYVSYSQAFAPNLGTTSSGGELKPTTGDQKELGVKYLSPAKDLSVDFAYFDIEQENRIAQGDVPGGVKQTGAVIDGWEAEIRKSWARVEWLANYTELEAKDGTTDVRLSAVPEKVVSTWGKYQHPNGVRAGAGARYISDTVGSGGGPQIASVALYDAMVGYEYQQWDFSLDAKNLTDKTYVSWCRYAGGDCGYGERRNITGNVRYKF